MSLGQRIKDLRKERGFTQETLAEATGISRGSIGQWETNLHKPDFEKLEVVANVLRVPMAAFFEDTLINKLIPLIGKASCGIPQEYDLNGYEPVPIDSRLYNDGMYAIEAEGDSMATKINEGDIIYCDPSQSIENGNIVHYRIGDESGIKKFKINEEKTIISLLPLNPEHDPIIVDHYNTQNISMVKVVGSVDTNY